MRLAVSAIALSTATMLPGASSAQEPEAPAHRLLRPAAATPACPMPVHVPAQRIAMPVIQPDTAVRGSIVVVEPRCHNPLGPIAVKAPTQHPDTGLSQALTDVTRKGWLRWQKPQPPDTSKRTPGG